MRYFLFILLPILTLTSCSQQKVNTNYETGQITKVQMGTVKKVHKFVVTRDAVGEGAFAEMASNAVGSITPGILAAGTTKIASATGSLMDSKLETVAKIRIRIEVDSPEVKAEPQPAPAAAEGGEMALVSNKPVKKPAELVEIIQNDVPGMNFYEGQRVVISTGSTPGNVWPE